MPILNTKTLLTVLSLILPERSDARTVRTLCDAELLSLTHPRAIDRTMALLPFSDPRVRACIHEAKFHENIKAFALLGTVLATYLAEQNVGTILPIPLSAKRQKERGYNQVTCIAKAARSHIDIRICGDVLYKRVDTPPQTSLTKEKRLKNVRDVFAIYDTERARHTIYDQHVIVIDDVTTTGATLAAARAALTPLRPASITCLALAH